MRVFSESELLEKAKNYSNILFYGEILTESAQNRPNVFLCHSHLDKNLAKGLVVLLAEYGVEAYVDWLDSSMPENTNGETANRLKSKIRSSDVLLFLASVNSKSSRWCPWEIGYADSSNIEVLIFPTTDGETIQGNEYLELYPYVTMGENKGKTKHGFAVVSENKAIKWLNDYLSVLGGKNG